MAETKMAKYLITNTKKGVKLPDFRTDKIGGTQGREDIVWLDDTVVPKARIYSECVWFLPGMEKGKGDEPYMKEHTHDFEEVLAFFGSDNDKPRDLCGELEIWLDGEKHTVTKTSLIFIPKGMKHGPMTFRKIDKPIFHFSIGGTNKYTGNSPAATKESKKATKKTDKLIVDFMQPPKVEAPWSPNPPPAEAAKGKGGRILFLDNDIIPDGFYTECVWILPFKGPMPKMTDEMLQKARAAVKPHKHDFDEVLCFFSANPKDFHNLDSEIELWLGGEKQMITKSTMTYIPAGVEHCPLVFHRIGSPLIHFTCFPEGKIYFTGLKKGAK